MAISEKNRIKINRPDTTFLILDSAGVTDDEAIELADLLKDKTNIKEISAYGNAIGDRGAKALLSLPQLEKLNLSNSHFSEEVIIAMVPYLRIKQLHIADTSVSARSLASLLANPYLEILNVTYCPITQADLLNIQLPINRTLKLLHFKSPIGDRGIIHLMASLPELEHLSIFSCHNTNAGIQALLTQEKQLKSLYVGGKFITDDAFSPLAEFDYDGQLEELNIMYAKAGTKTLSYILKNRVLTKVSFSSGTLTKEEENLLKQYLEQNRLNKQFGTLTIDTAYKSAKKNANQFGQSSNFFQDKQKIKGQSPQANEDAMVCTP